MNIFSQIVDLQSKQQRRLRRRTNEVLVNAQAKADADAATAAPSRIN